MVSLLPSALVHPALLQPAFAQPALFPPALAQPNLFQPLAQLQTALVPQAAFEQPSESLTVHGLPTTLTDEQLNAVFAQYGTVEQCKMLEPVPGALTCGALVQMQTVEEGTWLVQNLNNNIPSGLTMPVTVQYQTVADVHPQPAVNDIAILNAAVQAAAGLPGLGAFPTVGLSVPTSVPEPAPAPVQTFEVGKQLTGTVKRWDDQKGFGFIVPDGGGPDVFVHVRELDGDKLVNGTAVVFEAMQDPAKGPGRYRARNCKGAISRDEASASQAVNSDNLFITGLPLEIAEERIKEIFSQYGMIASVKKLGNQPGKSDAAALVRMGDMEQAKWMVENVNNNIPTGLTQPVNVRFAENKGAGAGGKGAATTGLGALGKISALSPFNSLFAPY